MYTLSWADRYVQQEQRREVFYTTPCRLEIRRGDGITEMTSCIRVFACMRTTRSPCKSVVISETDGLAGDLLAIGP